MTNLPEILAKHLLWLNNEGGERANLEGANLEGTNLMGANLKGANFKGANLVGANIDYSCWPLWCGSVGVHVDTKQSVQLLAHWWYAHCDDPEVMAIKNDHKVIAFLQSFHHITECRNISETPPSP